MTWLGDGVHLEHHPGRSRPYGRTQITTSHSRKADGDIHSLGPCLDPGGTYQEEPISTKHVSREWPNASQSYECRHIIQTDRSAV